MKQASVYRRLAAKWLEAAEHVENRSLKRCYAKRALTYEALAATAEQQEAGGRASAGDAPPGDTRH